MTPDKTSRSRPDRSRPDRMRPERNVGSSERTECGWFLAIVMGLVASVLALVAVFFAIAVYDYSVSGQPAFLGKLASAGSYLATGVGGFVAGKKAGRRGLIYGSLVGLVFAAAILVTGAGSPAAVPLTSSTFKRLLFSIVAGGLGGMFGVAST
ncbi:MAG: TIGR04086 family membrane protein [Betaproteobacteria bacterium]